MRKWFCFGTVFVGFTYTDFKVYAIESLISGPSRYVDLVVVVGLSHSLSFATFLALLFLYNVVQTKIDHESSHSLL